MPTSFTISISDSIGAVSCLLDEAAEPIAVLTLAHGAGAPMSHSFLSTLTEQLVAHSVSVVRFNFPYMEKQSKRPDVPAVAQKTVEVVQDKVHAMFPSLPLFLSGKSFGGRMSSQFLAKTCPVYVKGIIFFGFPLHPAGKPATERADHLKMLPVPKLFLQGTKDALAKVDLINEVVAGLSAATLIAYEGADHSFKSGKNLFIDALARDAHDWITKIIKA